MVRLTIALLVVLTVLYYTLRDDPETGFTYTPPEIITVEELPPIEEINDN